MKPVLTSLSHLVCLRRVPLACRRRLVSLLTIALCAMGQTVPSPVFAKGSPFVIGPAPAWVETVASNDAEPAQTNSSGTICLLNDRQIRVTAAGVERYYRRVNKVLTAAGLEDVSQLELEFEPSYQKLVIHHVRIRRGDITINALKPGEIKVVQKEEELAQRVYNGTLSAVLFLNDVRVGDVVDYGYSVNGNNPVLRGQYADTYTMAGRLSTGKIRWRLLWPSSKKLLYRNRNSDAQAVVRQVGDETEYVWEQNNVEELEFEPDTPSWFSSVPFVQLSDFADWSAVVHWALPLYRVQRPLAPELVAQIDRWRKETQDPAQRVVKALTFVQDEVRYTGIELGPYSHTPTQPNAVFSRRFGDCKDKSLLLCAALNELGIEAYPALVDTGSRATIVEDQPSPYAFNHVIVRVALDGKSYWLDPTIGLQRGSLARRGNPGYGRGLVIREGNLDLEEIPRNRVDEPATEVRETYTAPSYQAPTFLEVATTYRGADADAMRVQLSQQSLSELGKTYVGYYAQQESSIESIGPIEVKDDQDSNTVRLVERYKIPGFWKEGRGEFYARQISERLGKMPAATRKSPLGLGDPSYFTEIIEAQLPEHFSVSEHSGTVATNCLDFTYSLGSKGNNVTLAYRLRQLTDHVPVDGLSRHSEAIAKIQKVLGYQLDRDAGGGVDDATLAKSYIPLLLVVAPFVVFGAIKLIRRRRLQARRTEYKRSLKVSAGETPEFAIPVSSAREFNIHLMAFRCACGAAYSATPDALAHDSVMFDGRRISVVSLKCHRCARPRDVYFAVAGATANS